jgi:hypothetical protein
MPEQTLHCLMHVCTAHRATGGRQHLDDGPLHHTVAQPTRHWLHRNRSPQPGRLSQRASRCLEHVARGPEGFESCPTKCIIQ